MGNLAPYCSTEALAGYGSFDSQYEVNEESCIGTGKFSVVHLCRCRHQPEKRYALKVISAYSDDQNRIYEEIRIMRELGSHPAIVQLVDIDDSLPNTIRLVLELCKGGELFDRIQQKQYYPEAEAKVLIKNLVSAIACVHSKGIMHRDLKPENILLVSKQSDTDIKISDFGLAKMSKDYPRRLPRSNSICGSDFYLAPEVIKQEEYGREIDIWSTGVVCYVVLCGSLPFFHNVLHKLYRQIVERDLSFPEPAWRSCAPGSVDFVLRLLQVKPGDRLTADQTLNHPWLRCVGKKDGSFGDDFSSSPTQHVRSTPHLPHPLQHPRKV